MCFFFALRGGVLAEDCEKADRILRYVEGKLSNPAERVYALKKAVSECPSHVNARMNLAASLLALSQHGSTNIKVQNQLLDEARGHYEQALKCDKNLFDAHVFLGKICSVQGRFEMACNFYQKALELKPSDAEVEDALKSLQQELSYHTQGLKKSDQIESRFKRSTENKKPNLLGLENFTIPKHRERFNNILFDEWSYEINRPESIAQLNEIGKALETLKERQVRFVVEGHTDNRGGFDRNMILSQQRAEAVNTYLTDHFQIDPSNIFTQGFGYDRPLVLNDSAENMRKNRRVEILFIQ
jgi:outer membrane protein OmpA-like peptidoglycan-associated protein